MDQLLHREKTGNSSSSRSSARVLLAPLDWGLGHATRCIPIIKELTNRGCEVILAGEGAQKTLLQTEFPSLRFLDLPGYRIEYARTKSGLFWKMLRQSGRLKKAIKQENEWLKKTILQNNIDAVISDNRYGLHHPAIPCIIITHQLLIKTFLGRWTENLLQRKNFEYINQFSACWIPDWPGEKNLAGILSHPEKNPLTPIRYIGPLSRFNADDLNANKEIKDHLVVLISGPEPQRSIFEDKIIQEIGHYHGSATIVRGLPSSDSMIPSTNSIRIYNHLPSKELEAELLQAEFVISRSGYSTVMDLVKLKKKAILVPTPGQTEQEYLGKYLMEKGIALNQTQTNFSLKTALPLARKFEYKLFWQAGSGELEAAIDEMFAKIQG